MNDLIVTPKEWVESFGEIAKFAAQVVGEVFRLRVFKFFGEALRQAGILIVGSALVICLLVFIVGLTCGAVGQTIATGELCDGAADGLDRTHQVLPEVDAVDGHVEQVAGAGPLFVLPPSPARFGQVEEPLATKVSRRAERPG